MPWSLWTLYVLFISAHSTLSVESAFQLMTMRENTVLANLNNDSYSGKLSSGWFFVVEPHWFFMMALTKKGRKSTNACLQRVCKTVLLLLNCACKFNTKKKTRFQFSGPKSRCLVECKTINCPAFAVSTSSQSECTIYTPDSAQENVLVLHEDTDWNLYYVDPKQG